MANFRRILNCGLCHEVPIDAVVHTCGFSFCEPCLHGRRATTGLVLCPRCSRPPQALVIPDHRLRRMVNEINRYESPERHEDALLPAIVKDHLDCTVCLRDLVMPVILNCGHSFCAACVDHWLRERDTCPTCECHTVLALSNETLLRLQDEYVRKL